jgi:hypothetical protein
MLKLGFQLAEAGPWLQPSCATGAGRWLGASSEPRDVAMVIRPGASSQTVSTLTRVLHLCCTRSTQAPTHHSWPAVHAIERASHRTQLRAGI